MPDPDKIQRDLTSQCNTTFNIPLRPQINLETRDGKTIVITYVPEASPISKPVYIKSKKQTDGTYRRIGSCDVKANDSDFELFYQERQS